MGRSASTDEAKTDPVCGMNVDPGQTDLVAIFEGKNYYFCAEGCRKAFEGKPQKYLKPRQKNWFGRYMDRMAGANREVFGSEGPKCH